MKVLHIITSLRTGGAEHLLVTLLPRLQKTGCEVEILLFDGTPTPFYHQLEEEKIPIHTLGLGRMAMHNPLLAFRLHHFLKNHTYDIIHTHNTPCQLLTALVAGRRKNTLITTEHSTSNHRRSWRWYRSVDRWMYRKYDRIICVNQSPQENLTQWLSDPLITQCIQTIPNGIDVSLYASARTAKTTTRTAPKRLLLMVAAFRPQKDQQTVIRAMQWLPDDFRLWLVGDGETRAACETLVKSLHLEERVTMMGQRTDIPELLSSADIFVMSSPCEGLPLAVVEAMAAGKPVVGSDVPGVRELVQDAGLLFPHKNDKALAATVLKLSADPELYASVATCCRQRAEQYDISQMTQSYAEVYRRSVQPKIILATTIPTSMLSFWKGWLRSLNKTYQVIALSSPEPELNEVEESEGVATCGIRMERQPAPLKDLSALWQLIRTFRHIRPGMVHSMTPKAGLLCMLAAWIARVPVRVHTFTGLVFPARQGWLRRVLMLTDSITCACATHIIAEGEGVKDDLLRYHITNKELLVLGHGNVRGIDLDYYRQTPEVTARAAAICMQHHIPAEAFIFLFVGRLVRDKGIDELVHAFGRLQKEFPQTYLLLVGREEEELDPLSADTAKMIRNHPHILYPGQQQDVRPWYAMANVLVHPSHREGFPNVVIEAGAMGLPCIVTDINGSREIILPGENGVIIPSLDEEQLYATMRDWVQHPETPRRLAHEDRRLVATRYEQGFVRKCTMDFYRSIITAPSC